MPLPISIGRTSLSDMYATGHSYHRSIYVISNHSAYLYTCFPILSAYCSLKISIETRMLSMFTRLTIASALLHLNKGGVQIPRTGTSGSSRRSRGPLKAGLAGPRLSQKAQKGEQYHDGSGASRTPLTTTGCHGQLCRCHKPRAVGSPPTWTSAGNDQSTERRRIVRELSERTSRTTSVSTASQ